MTIVQKQSTLKPTHSDRPVSLSAAEARLGGRFRLDTRRKDNGDRLLQMCADHRLFLCSTNFRNSGNRLTTWCSPSNQRRIHIAVSYRWRGSIPACHSFWDTGVGSDHALVRCCFSLRFSGVRKMRTPRLAIEKLVDPEVKQNYQNQLLECLPDGKMSDINSHWEKPRITFTNLRHLWRQEGTSLDPRGRVFQATVRAAVSYGCETWLLRTGF
ncbi:LOW QUALITY PROTEIN: hypothetical protein T265_13751 [Opisthorchis viverrini]|uniref:Uncharacterized protein n=1 Tax=Opisthorchis viverrini TaxID=6198 RepID=A0A075AFG0_OPIVI|nr:LOW QUALITY PROTEIN: hypothetical protein T265_13751 [Opisthorchis viverrini]KER27689.1 LOW QUALITY PROTEIN: hypothetical protein T265_13751 [Opisthorchis viverrini]